MHNSGRTIFAAVLAFAGLLACGGGGSGGGDAGAPGGGGGGGGTQVAPDMSAVPESMTPGERYAALETVRQYRLGAYTGDIDADNQALVDYIRTLSTEFADAGLSPERTVWARFMDGFPAIFVSKTLPPGTPLPAAAIGTRLSPEVAPLAQIPQGDKAVLIDVDFLAAGSLATIEPALIKKNYVTSRPKGTISDFMGIRDVSVFFVSSHGGYAVAKNGVGTYFILTNEKHVTHDPNDAYLVSLDTLYRTGELIPGPVEAHDSNGVLMYSAGFWAITEKFVRNNWGNAGSKGFATNSLVAIDTCEMFLDTRLNTVTDKAPYEDFRDALKSANAGTLLGWDGQVSPSFASNVMRLFFDRVLGANAYNPETPFQRPFPHVQVYDWLVNTAQHSEAGGGTLRLQYPQALPGQLVPTIHSANVFNPAPGALHEGIWVLEISGEFGTEEGVVSVNGTALALLEPWDNSTLVAALPPSMTGPGSFGDLIVKVRDHPSNAVPLTQWSGTVSQVQIGTDIGVGARLDVSCPIQGTTDVHAARSRPAGTPQRISVLILELTGPCSYTLSGTWPDGTTRYDLSGSGSASPIVPLPVVGGLTYAGGNVALPASLQGGVGFLLLAPGNLRVTNTTDNSFVDDAVNGTWALGQGDVTLNANYSITTGSRVCLGATQCSETWSLTPIAAPLLDTES